MELVLVKGYQLRTSEMIQNGTEQLFARYPNGNIKTIVKEYSSNFYTDDVRWEHTHSIPDDARFIGTYMEPK